jgi:tetratricopeptide (TPR) repeat protein
VWSSDLYERALAIWEQALGPTHPATATSLNNLAALLRAQGDLGAARPLYERALAIREQALGPTHPATATSLNNLGSLCYAEGDYAEALRLQERALAVVEQVLGSEHPTTRLYRKNVASDRAALEAGAGRATDESAGGLETVKKVQWAASSASS